MVCYCEGERLPPDFAAEHILSSDHSEGSEELPEDSLSCLFCVFERKNVLHVFSAAHARIIQFFESNNI